MGKIKFCSFKLILFLCIFSFLGSVSRCQTLTDTIKPGDSLGPTSYLTSSNGRFTLKFFNISSIVGSLQILWQSFDYPTDTLLPGMKLGINHRTGHTWNLTSWLTDERSAAGGGFSVDWNSTGTNEIVVRRLDQVYWTSGTVTAQDLKNVVSLSSSWYRYNFSIISNTEESSFSYSLAEDKASWWVVSPTGQFTDESTELNMAIFLPEDACNVAGNSNPFPGCAKQESTVCRSDDEALVKKAGVSYNYRKRAFLSLNCM